MRQLAAILFIDMTGYTSLMQENEQLGRSKRKRLKEVLESSLTKYRGKILQNYGDGYLNIFPSAIDSVRCAIEIQTQLQENPVVDVRIGIHTGDVVIEEDAIYGDGVNIASRVEGLAKPGSVLISEKVYDEIRNQDNISVRELGFFEFKNVREPIKIFAIDHQGIVVPRRHEVQGKTKQPVNRLAVLPFVNMSADPDNEYFSDGITEELLNALTKVDGLQVTSRTSVFAFKGKNSDIRDIALTLNVDKVLEGSVRKAGNRVRITAQLINAADGYHLWSENYDRNLTDIFEVQDEISGIIANRLRENLSAPAEKNEQHKTHSHDINAYTHFLKGLHYWNKVTPSDARKAIECFQKAISIEPEYAQAYAMIAGAHSYLGSTGQMLPSKAFEIVHTYAKKALEIDDNVAEGHIALASAYLFYDWKWKESFEELQKAIKLNPGAMDAYHLLSFYHLAVGEKHKSVEILEKALRIDPLSPIINHALGDMYIFEERYDDAIRQADKLLEMDPHMRASLEMKAWATGMRGDWKKAMEYFEEVHRLTNHPLKGLMGIGYTSAILGDTERAMDCIRKIEQRQQEEPDSVLDVDLMGIWYALGDVEKVIFYLNKAIEKRTMPVNFYLEYPVFKELRKDPRIVGLKKKVMGDYA